jgi:hypothetical protein
MSIILFADNASTTLAAGIANSDTSITVATGTGVLFPAPSAGQIAFATLEDVSGNIEIVTITARTTDTFVVTRGTDGTTPRAFASGTRFEMRVTMGMLNVFLQKTGGDTLSGTTTVSGVLNLGSGGSIQDGEYAGGAIRSQPGDTSNQIKVPVGSPATAAGSVILTTANFLSQLPSGVGAVISGMILIWSGLSTNIPSGYVLCNGTNGTPDLRDQFVLGGGGSLPTSGGSASTTTGAAATGVTIAATVLTVDQLPAHHHTFFSGLAASGNSAGKCPDWAAGGVANVNIPSGSPYAGTQIIGDTGSGNPHTHAVTDPQHTHSYSLPPYRALFYIMKT